MMKQYMKNKSLFLQKEELLSRIYGAQNETYIED